jgi:hypothetical protein
MTISRILIERYISLWSVHSTSDGRREFIMWRCTIPHDPDLRTAKLQTLIDLLTCSLTFRRCSTIKVGKIRNTLLYNQSFSSLLFICRTPIWISLIPVASVLSVNFPINIQGCFVRKQCALKEVRFFLIRRQTTSTFRLVCHRLTEGKGYGWNFALDETSCSVLFGTSSSLALHVISSLGLAEVFAVITCLPSSAIQERHDTGLSAPYPVSLNFFKSFAIADSPTGFLYGCVLLNSTATCICV